MSMRARDAHVTLSRGPATNRDPLDRVSPLTGQRRTANQWPRGMQPMAGKRHPSRSFSANASVSILAVPCSTESITDGVGDIWGGVEYPDEGFPPPNPSTPGSASYPGSDDVEQQPQQLLHLHSSLGLPHPHSHPHPHLPPHSHLQLDPSLIPLTHPAAATAYSFHQQHKRTTSTSSTSDPAAKRRRSDAALLNPSALHPPSEYLPSPSTVSVSELEYQHPHAPSASVGEYVSGQPPAESYPPQPGEFAQPPSEFSAPSAPYGENRQEYARQSQSSGSGETAQSQPEHEDADALDEEPLYVNAKQYHRILKRRTARARLEEVHRLSKERKVS